MCDRSPYKIVSAAGPVLSNHQLVMRSCLCLLFHLLMTSAAFSQGSTVASNEHSLEPGSGLLPLPQQLSLSTQLYAIDDSWTVILAAGISQNDPALSNLVSESRERFGLRL